MKAMIYLLLGLTALSCAPSQFATWQVEEFDATPITGSETKMISLRNDSASSLQAVLGVGFDGKGNGKQHFTIDKVMVSDRIVETKDIIVPPGSSLNIQITYKPRNLETTQASFGGLVTGEEDRFIPYDPKNPPQPEEIPEAIHRVVLLAVYESPKQGIAQIELRGRAVEGPNGEISLPELGGGVCETGDGVACFEGNFSIDVPDLFAGGAKIQPLPGPIRFQINGSQASLKMEDMPPIILFLEGNGPGEPLEGQPVSAVSIIVRGVPGKEGKGSFDGTQLELKDLVFRIQIVVGKIKVEEILTSTPLVDFTLEGLSLTTEEPLLDGHATFLIDTTLSETPSGNPLFDDFLGETQILVRFIGGLNL